MTNFPDGKQFAFTVFDDTDNGTVSNLTPVYSLLAELGMTTTKSVWPLACDPKGTCPGQTLQDEEYVEWVMSLHKQGFEIASHGASNFDSTRDSWKLALQCFQDKLGFIPRTHCNHSSNRDNIYWGDARVSVMHHKLFYNIATRFKRRGVFQGHIEASKYFWGDICNEHISFVRNFSFDEINLDRINPSMPYRDPTKPFVKNWFSSSDGGNLGKFCNIIAEKNQDKLEDEGGVCIMYTHFASGFVENGVVNPNFERLMRRLAAKDGWFVPVSKLLNHLGETRSSPAIPIGELIRMEGKWLLSKLFRGTT